MNRNLFPQSPSEDAIVGIHLEEIPMLKRALEQAEQFLVDQEVEEPSTYIPTFLEDSQELDFSDMTASECASFWEIILMMNNHPNFDKVKVRELCIKLSPACLWVCNTQGFPRDFDDE